MRLRQTCLNITIWQGFAAFNMVELDVVLSFHTSMYVIRRKDYQTGVVECVFS